MNKKGVTSIEYKYVIITPAHNEASCIRNTIESVIRQTKLPVLWVIVNDRSIDDTGKIVTEYLEQFPFIKLINISGKQDRNFGSKVKAFNKGLNVLKDNNYEFIGNLDADISFEINYFEQIIDKFMSNEKLGLAGGIIYENINNKFKPQNISHNSVAGAVQLFRKKCFEEIGGYLPLHYGGIDAAAEIMARMKGWQVQTFPNIKTNHHRRVSKGTGSILKSRFRNGVTYYLLGYHPLFLLISVILRLFERPIILGSILKISGFAWANLYKYERPVTSSFIKYLRNEQINRITQKKKS